MADKTDTTPTETEAEKEIREANEAREKYLAAQAKVQSRANDERDKQLKPYKDLTESKKFKDLEADVSALFQIDGIMADRGLFQNLQTLQESFRIIRENVANRSTTPVTTPVPMVA